MKKFQFIFWISTALLSALVLFSAGMYFFNNAEVQQHFEFLGYPSYIVIPLGICKILGIITILFINNQNLKEWAYAAFCFNFTLALIAHLVAQDNEFFGAVVALILLFTSYFSRKKVFA